MPPASVDAQVLARLNAIDTRLATLEATIKEVLRLLSDVQAAVINAEVAASRTAEG